jgi:hypothetical protein
MKTRLRILVPVFAIVLVTSACGSSDDGSSSDGDGGSEAATVNDVYTTLNNGTPDYECDFVPAGARCWLFTDETASASNIFITSEGGDPNSPVVTIFGGVTADPATVESVATTLGVPNDDALWIEGVGFIYNASHS